MFFEHHTFDRMERIIIFIVNLFCQIFSLNVRDRVA